MSLRLLVVDAAVMVEESGVAKAKRARWVRSSRGGMRPFEDWKLN
jgi:hypothetical protein